MIPHTVRRLHIALPFICGKEVYELWLQAVLIHMTTSYHWIVLKVYKCGKYVCQDQWHIMKV